jgi:c-di-GMP-related signal transduction protein
MAQNSKFLIGRQPIMNRNDQIVAYELLFRSAESQATAKLKNASHATANVIVNALSGFGMKEILGDRQGFINVDSDLLLSDAIEILPPESIGLDLVGGIEVTPKIVARCRQLKERGFVLALAGDEQTPGQAELYDLVDIVKIDLLRTAAELLRPRVEQLRRYPCKLLAEKVDSREVFRTCQRLGFDYFQGYYFARPAVMEKKKVDSSHAALLKLLRLLLADATVGELDQVFRSSPTLTYNLLKLVNSVAFGVREKIRDVRHALSILGRQQLKRWVQLSLFSSDGAEAKDNPLLELAASRAAFMEQLVGQHPELSKQYSATDQAFMVGILSLLDTIYQVSIEEIVTDLNLSDDVRLALVQHKGVYGRLLELTIMMERLELGGGAMGLQEMGISLEKIIESQIKALSWREVVG